MATLVLLASILLSWWLLIRKRTLARQRQTESFPAKLVGHLFEWSASLAIVLLFYHLLLAFVAFGWRWITAEKLERLEESLAALQRLTGEYKLTWGMSMAWLLVLYLLARWWIRFLDRETPFRAFKNFKKVLHVISTVVFLLSSFTLLGSAPGEAAATLEIHLRQERKEYGVLRQDLKRVLEDKTIQRAYDNASKALPGTHSVRDLLSNSIDERSRLRDTYAEARTKYAIRDPRIDTLLRRDSDRLAKLDRTIHTAPKESPHSDADEIRLPGNITYERLEKAKSRVEALKTKLRPYFERTIKRPGGKDLVLELPGGPLDQFFEAMKPLEEIHPVMKAFLDLTKSALSDSIEARLRPELDKLAESTIEHPEDTETAVSKVAQELADAKPARPTPEEAKQYKRDVAEVQQEDREFHTSAERLQQRMNEAEARRTTQARNNQPSQDDGGRNGTHTRRAEARRHERPRGGDVGIETRASRQPYIPDQPVTPRVDPPFDPGSGSTGGQIVTGCTCNHYRNGVLVSSSQIPVGARCGFQVCGQP
jgi:hypothetical protein